MKSSTAGSHGFRLVPSKWATALAFAATILSLLLSPGIVLFFPFDYRR